MTKKMLTRKRSLMSEKREPIMKETFLFGTFGTTQKKKKNNSK